MMKKFLYSFMLAILLAPVRYAGAKEPIIIDSRHYSNVLGEIRNFRIFLPPGYYDEPGKRYPVIYYYHGWSQRYFGSTTTPAADEGESNNGDNIANFVAANEVIVVKPDGYNRKPKDEYYLRPYNISPVETYRQYPLYFPELVNYIDANFNTIADREHRAISGLSMGGFMSFWISGKYPDLVSAAGNFCGSPEFFAGPENFPAEYRHIDMAGNYAGVNVRLNFGNKDFIRCYHRDLNRIWPNIIDNYEYKIYEADHTTCGLGEMFTFIMNTFKNPPVRPERWDHIDVYPEFGVWDYLVSTDRGVPGFTILENVDRNGFRSSVREFLPDGGLLDDVRVSVTTAPIYEKNREYFISDLDKGTLVWSHKTSRSDNSGKLKIDTDGGIHEIGINKPGDPPVILVASAKLAGSPWAVAGRETNLKITLLNKGITSAGNVKALLSSDHKNVKIIRNSADFGNIGPDEIKEGRSELAFSVSPDSIEAVRLTITIRDSKNNEWIDHIEISVRKDLPLIKDFIIADGKTFKVASSGIDSADVFLGIGNGDGIANPGESVVLLVRDGRLYRRTESISGDQFVNPGGVNIRMSDNWAPYDHVGGSAKYTAPLISSECPEEHWIEFLSSYWLPDYPDHIIRQGKIRIRVTGKDTTPPVIRFADVTGDNTIRVKGYDGSAISNLKVLLTNKDDPKKNFEAVLNDEGKEGDRVKHDGLFSMKIPEKGFGQYRIEVEATDSFGNNKREEWNSLFVIH